RSLRRHSADARPQQGWRLWRRFLGTERGAQQSELLGQFFESRRALSLFWDQTPHLISTSAKTVFGGVGTAQLTVDPTLRANMQANHANATASGAAGVTARTNIENFINNAEGPLMMGT